MLISCCWESVNCVLIIDVISAELGSCNMFMSTLMERKYVALKLFDKGLISSESFILWFSDPNGSISVVRQLDK